MNIIEIFNSLMHFPKFALFTHCFLSPLHVACLHLEALNAFLQWVCVMFWQNLGLVKVGDPRGGAKGAIIVFQQILKFVTLFFVRYQTQNYSLVINYSHTQTTLHKIKTKMNSIRDNAAARV